MRDRIVNYLAGLRFPYLVAATAVLFVVNLFVPDVLPFVDELLLALLAVILARFKKRRAPAPAKPPSGTA